MNYKQFIKAINNRFLRGRQPTKRVHSNYIKVSVVYDVRFDKIKDEVALLIWFLVDHSVYSIRQNNFFFFYFA
jgi:hypothetical protein